MTEIRTLRAPHAHEIDKVRGSRFLARALPVSDPEAAARELARIAELERDATHHVFAWRLGPDGSRWRASDDGEPSGSAGRPVLQELEARALVDVLVVVSRWFGGTKLGVGGLVRAYGAAAAAVLDGAEVLVRRVTRTLRVQHPYPCSGAVAAVLAAHALEPRAASYGTDVTFLVDVPLEEAEAFAEELAERTGARARVRPAGPGLSP